MKEEAKPDHFEPQEREAGDGRRTEEPARARRELVSRFFGLRRRRCFVAFDAAGETERKACGRETDPGCGQTGPAHPERLDQDEVTGQRADHGAERVPTVQPAEDAAESRILSIERGNHHRQGRSHRGRRNQQEQEGKAEPQGVDQPCRCEERFHHAREQRGERGQADDQRKARDPDGELEHRIRPDRAEATGPQPRRQGIAERKPTHEPGQHQARGPDRVPERDPRLIEPEVLEDQRSAAGEKKDRGEEVLDHGTAGRHSSLLGQTEGPIRRTGSRVRPSTKTRADPRSHAAEQPCACPNLVPIMRSRGVRAARFHFQGVCDDSFLFLFDCGFLPDVRHRLR